MLCKNEVDQYSNIVQNRVLSVCGGRGVEEANYKTDCLFAQNKRSKAT